MYKLNIKNETCISCNESVVGESIENRVKRILTSGEPISDTAPEIFTERKDGVKPEFNVRTDRFEIAIDAMTEGAKSDIAKREERIKNSEDPKNEKLEPIQGTEQK